MWRQPRLRLVLACMLVSVWMFLLLTGWAGGVLVHALLLSAIVAWPWAGT